MNWPPHPSPKKVPDFQSAAAIYRELTVLTPKDYIAFNNLAYILCENLQQADQAVQAAQQALALVDDGDAQKSNILDTLGWAYFKSGDSDTARAKLLESVRYEQGLHNQYHLVLVLIDKRFEREAKQHLRSLRRTAQKMKNIEFLEKAAKLLAKF